MSGSALMNLGMRAMTANYASLQTTGNNIANANTVGYSRQETQLANSGGQYTGAGFFGQGVDIVTVSRSYDKFLTTQANATKAASAADTTRRDQLTQLEGVFTTGETGLGYAAGQLLNAFVDVANNPADASARQVIVSQSVDVASRFKAAGDQVSALQSAVVDDVRSAVASVNGLAKQIATLNSNIVAFNGTGHSPNDLLDTRNRLLNEVNQYIGVTTVEADDGSLGVFLGGGQSLVLGSTANALKAVPDEYDPAKVRLAVREGSANRLVPGQSIHGGSLAGQMDFQNIDLVDARNLLGQLASALSGNLNRQQSLGLDLSGAHGAAMFDVGNPRVLGVASNTGDAALQLRVADSTHVLANDYELRFDGTSYTLDRLDSDGTRTPAGGSPLSDISNLDFDGLNLQVTSGSMQPGDRFLLQPVATAAQSMRSVLHDGNQIAAASPVTATFGVANKGTASLLLLSAVSPNVDASLLPSNLTFDVPLNDGTGRVPYNVLNADGSATSGLWTPGSPIVLNGYALQMDGAPKTGDTLDVRAGVIGGNNGNALAFAQLAAAPVVGATVSAAGVPVAGRSITDAYASALSTIAVRVQSARTGADTSAAFASAAESARSDKAGVNLDEEASKLIQFQQSYQASAKVLQVAQALFDTLLRIGSG